MIKIVSSKEAEKIYDTGKPLGLFLILENGAYIGIDNSTNDAWEEEFSDLRKCLKWLNGGDVTF